ncbi:type I-E CRISPR-associated protein Cse2/CasB [Immundisolibacter sp.]|uniref:type I-E CRISPR-associated protein Cse2/CasB n=1 Tax=Immundisolibacter sp. TaxID=1934948 RepID=UPI000EDB9C9B|nr:type I-E CRISPR-associated protein Cse2/CasB [Gammaproteobacteria bacterium]
MNSDFRRNPGLRQALHDWWNGLNDQRGDRAQLRRAHNITAVVLTPAYQRVYRRLRAAGWRHAADAPVNDRLAAIVGLLAHVETHGDASLPQAMSARKPGDDRPAVSPLRFQRLLESPDLDALYSGLRRVLPLLQRPASIVALADDLLCWGDDVKKTWAYDYEWPVQKAD